MGLRALAKADLEDISSNLEEHGLEITFATPDGSIEIDVVGLESKTHRNFDLDTGKDINVQKAQVSVSEKFFIDVDYPVRNAAGNVNMKKHRVDYIDSTGSNCKFEVLEQFPDETLGFIVFILGDRKV